MSTEAETFVPFPENTIPSVRHVNVVRANAPPHKFIEHRSNEEIVWTEQDIAPRELMFLRHCKDCTITVNASIAKILIECCENLTINLPGKIRTNMIEIWKSKNATIHIGEAVYTAQVDMCENVELNFRSPKDYQQTVWSNTQRLAVNFREAPEHNTVTGLEQMHALYPDVLPTTDQFFLRFIDGVLTPEVLIRLPGGFPTTHREADQWDALHPDEPKLF